MSWETVKLGNISSNIQTGPFGSQLHKSDYSELGTPVIMPKDLLNGHVSENSIARVSQTHVDRLSRHQIEIGDIIYSRRGDVGRCALATEKEKGWLCGTGCLRVTVNLDFANPKFVFYQLQKAETIGWVEKHAVGATMLNLNTSILSDIPIELPELETQNKIVETLSNYDNLIENNQKQIKLLEEAAQRLYKEWFVDFRFPGHEHTPIVDGVPEGWLNKPIDKVFLIKYGKTLSTSKILSSGLYPVYGANGIIGYYNEKNCNDYKVLITSRGNGSGDVLRTYDKESFVTNNSFIISPLNDYMSFGYVYQLMKKIDFKVLCTGSAQPQLTNNSISKLTICVPPKSIIIKFEKLICDICEKINTLNYQNRCLNECRDRLLPKLMSGEIEV